MVMDRTGKLVDLEKMPPEEIARALPGMLFTGTNLLLCSEYTHLKALICEMHSDMIARQWVRHCDMTTPGPILTTSLLTPCTLPSSAARSYR